MPLSTHLLALVFGAMIPLVLFAAFMVRELADQERLASERRLMSAVRELASSLQQEVDATTRTLTALTASANLVRDDMTSLHAELARTLKTQPSWLNILLHTAGGERLINASAPYTTSQAPLAERASFDRVVAEGKPVLGDLAYGPLGALAFPIRVPLLRDGVVTHVLTAVISTNVLADLAGRFATTPEWTRTIVDANGTVAARSRLPETYVGKQATPSYLARVRAAEEGFARETSLDRRAVYLAFARVPTTMWAVSIAVPLEIFDASARRSMTLVTTVGLGLLAVFAGLAFVYSRHLTRRIRAAANAADDLAHGRSPSPVRSSVLEVQRLHVAFQRADGVLRAREAERDASLVRANAARAEAEAASEAKDKFLAMLGHELRNPLGAISNGVFLMRQLVPEDPELAEIQAIIARQLAHLTRLLDDLLDASRISRGKVVLETRLLDLRALVADIRADFAHRFEEAQLQLDVALPALVVPVRGDPTRLSQCLGNLLLNSLKFTPPGGHVRIALDCAEGTARLTVADDGAGIAADVLPTLFEPFVQGPQTLARSVGGLGLGLAVVKGLAALHGGTVYAESAGDGAGTSLHIDLPLAREPLPVMTDEPVEPRPSTGLHRVLVIEDITDAARSLAAILTRQGFQVIIADCGAEGLRVAQEFEPHAVICDIGLPDIDGYEVCRRLRQRPGGSGLRLIALTGYGQASDVRKALAAGFDHHLTKPVPLRDLLALLGGS